MYEEFLILYSWYKVCKNEAIWWFAWYKPSVEPLFNLLEENSDLFERVISEDHKEIIEFKLMEQILRLTSSPKFIIFCNLYNLNHQNQITFPFQPHIQLWSLLITSNSSQDKSALTADLMLRTYNLPINNIKEIISNLTQLKALLPDAKIAEAYVTKIISTTKNRTQTTRLIGMLAKHLDKSSCLEYITEADINEFILLLVDTNHLNDLKNIDLLINIVNILIVQRSVLEELIPFITTISQQSQVLLEDFYNALLILKNKNIRLSTNNLALLMNQSSNYTPIAQIMRQKYTSITREVIKKLAANPDITRLNNNNQLQSLLKARSEYTLQQDLQWILKQQDPHNLISKILLLSENNILKDNEPLESDLNQIMLQAPLDLIKIKHIIPFIDENTAKNLHANSWGILSYPEIFSILQEKNFLNIEIIQIINQVSRQEQEILPLSSLLTSQYCNHNNCTQILSISHDINKFYTIYNKLTKSSLFMEEHFQLFIQQADIITETILSSDSVCITGEEYLKLINILQQNTIPREKIDVINQHFQIFTEGSPIHDEAYQYAFRQEIIKPHTSALNLFQHKIPTPQQDISIGNPKWFGFGSDNPNNGQPIFPEFTKLYRQWQLLKIQQKSIPDFINQTFELCSQVYDDINSIYKVIIKQSSKDEFVQFCRTYNNNAANLNKIDFLDHRYIQLYILINKNQIQIDNIENFRESINQILNYPNTHYFEEPLRKLLETYQSIPQDTNKNIAINRLITYFLNNITQLIHNHNNPELDFQNVCNILMTICNNDSLCENISQQSLTDIPEILLSILQTPDHAIENASCSLNIAY